MTMKQEAQRWQDETLSSLDVLLEHAILAPDITPEQQVDLADAADEVLSGWKKITISFSASNRGYELRDLAVIQIQLLKRVEHKIHLLKTLGGAGL